MPTPSYTVTCTAKKTIAPETVELRFTKPDGFVYKPGQFVLFDVPLIANATDIQPRAYSMASTPDENELLFVVKLFTQGRFSDFCRNTLDVNTEMTMKGPFGLFTLDPLPDAHIVLAATGAGLAPFRSQILAALKSGDHRKIDLLFCVRKPEDLFWIDELREMAKTYPQFTLHISLTDGASDWPGLRGRVQEHIPGLITVPGKTLLYACGNPNMTKDVRQLAIERWSIPKKHVHVEGYI